MPEYPDEKRYKWRFSVRAIPNSSERAPHFFCPPGISSSFRQLSRMRGERDENYGSEKNQSSQLIAVGRGGFARGSDNCNDSQRLMEQATVVGSIFRQGADSVLDAGGDMAGAE